MTKIMDYTRQIGILPPNKIQGVKIVLIGVGGIGSPLGFTFGKMGFEDLEVWDFDTLVRHNLPNQLYKLRQLGDRKAEAFAENVAEYAQTKVKAIPKRYDGSPLSGIVISAVDSIEARREIWEGIKKSPKVSFYVEARMAGELFQVNTVRMNDPAEVAKYEDKMKTKVRVYKAPCTAGAIFYTVMCSAGVIGGLIKSYVCDQETPTGITVDLKRWKMMIE